MIYPINETEAMACFQLGMIYIGEWMQKITGRDKIWICPSISVDGLSVWLDWPMLLLQQTNQWLEIDC